MEILAETAHRHGGVDPNDDDAVVDFLEKNAGNIPDAEAERIITALAQRNQPRAAGAQNEAGTEIAARFTAVAEELAAGAQNEAGTEILEFKFPKLDDARREAKLYDQLQMFWPARAKERGEARAKERAEETRLRTRHVELMVSLVLRASYLVALLSIGFLTRAFGLSALIGVAIVAVLPLLERVGFDVVLRHSRWSQANEHDDHIRARE